MQSKKWETFNINKDALVIKAGVSVLHILKLPVYAFIFCQVYSVFKLCSNDQLS